MKVDRLRARLATVFDTAELARPINAGAAFTPEEAVMCAFALDSPPAAASVANLRG